MLNQLQFDDVERTQPDDDEPIFKTVPLSRRSHTYTVPQSYFSNLHNHPYVNHSCQYDSLDKLIQEASFEVDKARSCVENLEYTLQQVKDQPDVDAILILQDEGQAQAKLRSQSPVCDLRKELSLGQDPSITYGELKRQKWLREQEMLRSERIKAFEQRMQKERRSSVEEKSEKQVHNLGVSMMPGGGVSPDF